MPLYPYFHPEPLPDYITPALGNLASSLRQGEEQKRQQSQQEEDQRNQAIYAQYMRLAPDQQQKVYPMLPDSLRSMAFNPAAIPAHAPNELEQSQNAEALAKSRFGAKVATDSFNTFDTLPQSTRQEGTYQSGYGAAMPSESVKLANAQDVTRNKSSWTPEVQQRQAIEDKRALDAKDAATVPSENALRGAQASNQLSEVPLHRAQTANQYSEIPLHGAQTREASAKAAGQEQANTQNTTNVPAMVDALAKRQASLDDLAKKGSPLRQQLVEETRKRGVVPPSNEAERSNLVAADNTARLMSDRLNNLERLSPVVDSNVNRVLIANLIDAGDTGWQNFMKGTARKYVDADTINYIQELRNLREDQFALRKYLGNSPIRSDKQVNIMLSQSVGADAGSSNDVKRMIAAFRPAVDRLVIGNQAAGAPSLATGGSSSSGGGATNTPNTPSTSGTATTSKPLDESTARQFLQQAGGDKQKARQLAAAQGYTF